MFNIPYLQNFVVITQTKYIKMYTIKIKDTVNKNTIEVELNPDGSGLGQAITSTLYWDEKCTLVVNPLDYIASGETLYLKDNTLDVSPPSDYRYSDNPMPALTAGEEIHIMSIVKQIVDSKGYCGLSFCGSPSLRALVINGINDAFIEANKTVFNENIVDYN